MPGVEGAAQGFIYRRQVHGGVTLQQWRNAALVAPNSGLEATGAAPRPIIGGEGTLGMLPDQGICFDINRQEAFVYLVEDGVTDRPNVGPQDVTLGQLEAAAQ